MFGISTKLIHFTSLYSEKTHCLEHDMGKFCSFFYQKRKRKCSFCYLFSFCIHVFFQLEWDFISMIFYYTCKTCFIIFVNHSFLIDAKTIRSPSITRGMCESKHTSTCTKRKVSTAWEPRVARIDKPKGLLIKSHYFFDKETAARVTAVSF